MLKNYFYLLIIISALVSIISCKNSQAPQELNEKIEHSAVEGDTLQIGSLASIVQNEVLIYSSFMKYLSDSLRNYGISSVNINVARSLEELIKLMNNGEIDLYIDSPYPVYKVNKNTKMELFLKHNKNGAWLYRTVLFARKDAMIETIEDLKGKLLGFENPFSTSGYILPFLSLSKKGYLFSKIENVSDNKDSSRINYTFTSDDENTMYWVYAGKIDAGATDNVSFNQNAGIKRNDLKIFYETGEVPRSIVMINPTMNEKVRSRIHDLLLDMEKNPVGSIVLKDFFNSTGFKELDSAAIISLNIFRDLQK